MESVEVKTDKSETVKPTELKQQVDNSKPTKPKSVESTVEIHKPEVKVPAFEVIKQITEIFDEIKTQSEPIEQTIPKKSIVKHIPRRKTI